MAWLFHYSHNVIAARVLSTATQITHSANAIFRVVIAVLCDSPH